MVFIQKGEFIARLADAISSGSGFAAGKIGGSEKHFMLQPLVLGTEYQRSASRAYSISLKFHGFNQCALFPAELDFYAQYNEFFVRHIRNLDALGIFGEPNEARLIQHYSLDVPLMKFDDQEPDRSFPNDPTACYLPLFRDKRILIVTSQAEILVQRANQDTFENVWRKTGKPWFFPASVEALSFPHGWSPEAAMQYGDSLKLFESLATKMAARDFDIALIAASGLGIPLASEVKRLGKIGLSLGGHLQALFGVIGRRWREQEEWRTNYINEAWIDMPDCRSDWSVPGADGGAYW
jgi:hypothetical protein